MGSDDIFKKRKSRPKRQKEYLTPKANSFLIVTEVECTEPNYFMGLERLIKDNVGGIVDVVAAPRIDVVGKGVATTKLINETEEIVKKAKVLYQNVWVVFDKDDFIDFDNAIREGEKKGYNIAWSNQSFEYWIYLHFSYNDSALHRDDWVSKLNQLFKQRKLGNGYYEKNDARLFTILNEFDGPKIAIKNAKNRMAKFDSDNPSEFDPGTTVYELVEKLFSYLE